MRRNNLTVSIFAYATKGERSQTSREAIGNFIVDRSMRGYPHMQGRAEVLIKSAVQLKQ